MTKEEAVFILKGRMELASPELSKALGFAIQSTEKQIPMKVNHTRDESFVYWNVPVYECPICGKEIRFVLNEIKYCSRCGQALKCEGEEDE